MPISRFFKNVWLVQTVIVTLASAAFAGQAKVYVANEDESTITVVDAATFKTVANIPVGQKPHNVQVGPEGKVAWVTNDGPSKNNGDAHPQSANHEQDAGAGPGELWGIDTETDKVIARIGVGVHPSHVVISPDSLYAYVTNGGDGSVSVVDLQSKKSVATIKAGNYPHGIRISPDGKQAYVANLKGGTVSVIDTASRTQQSTIQVGKGPAQVGFTPDGQLAFVSLQVKIRSRCSTR